MFTMSSGVQSCRAKTAPALLRAMLIAFILIAAPVCALSGSAEVRKRCAPIERQIEQVNARMRHPYTVPEGEKLRDRLLQLRDRLHDCRNQRRYSG